MSLTIIQVTNKKELKQFVKFPFSLYSKCDRWIPPMIAEEMSNLALHDNPALENADLIMFLALRQNKVVGRIAGIVNWLEVRHKELKQARFGWLDFIDDREVSKALLEAVEKWAVQKGMERMEGPMGFSNFDKTGFLVSGFEYEPTLSTIYNYPYYIDHLKAHHYDSAAKYVEYEIKVPDVIPEKVGRLTDVIEERYKLRVLKVKDKRKIEKYLPQLFALINNTHSNLHGYIPLSEKQRKVYRDKFIKLVNTDFIVLITDQDDKLIAYALSIPSYGEAFKKAKGKLYPFGIFHLYKAMKNVRQVELLLIGVDEQYRSKGVTALIFKRLFDTYTQNGVLTVESNPELEDNLRVRTLWKSYDHIQHKSRRTFTKSLV